MNAAKQMDIRQRNKISVSLQSKIQNLSSRRRESKIGNPKSKIGLTLIEVMVVVLLIAVAVLGAMGFRLYCVTDAKKADVQINAARIASTILENWTGNGGPLNYDPATSLNMFSSQFAITKVGTSNNYWVRDKANSVSASDGIHYYVALSFSAGTSTTPKELNVAVSWLKNYNNVVSGANPIVHTIMMTAYAN